MLALLLSSLPILAAAHNAHHAHYGRQAQIPSPPPSVVSSLPAATLSASRSASLSGSSASASISVAPQVSVSIYATGPNAVPLTDIVASALMTTTDTGAPIWTTFAPGSVPSAIPNAPPLPSVAPINPADWPPLDQVPPIDSPQVQQWIQEVANSGVTIPDLAPTNGSAACSANPEAAADQSRCWWTCGHCTRETDLVSCPQPLHMGVGVDDGPGLFDNEYLQYLLSINLTAHFFHIGSRSLERIENTRTAYMLGHQIGDHTWSHPYLTTLTTEQVIAEIGWTRELHRQILGVTTNTMRPPYGDIDDRVRAIAAAMGYKVVIWTANAAGDFDTDDWMVPSGGKSSSWVVQNVEYIIGNATTLPTGFFMLQHSLWEQVVELGVGYIFPYIKSVSPAITMQSIGECLGLPPSDFYVETNNNQTNPPPNAGSVVVTSTAVSAKTTSKSADMSLVYSLDGRRTLVSVVCGSLALLGFFGSVGLLL